MGRKNIIPELETKIGGQLKPWLANKIREGNTPEQIAKELGIGKSKVYILIKDFDLKSVQKEVKKAQATGTQNELRKQIETYLAEKKTAGLSEETTRKDWDLWKNFLWWLENTGKPVNLSSIMSVETIRTYYTYLETSKNRFGREFKAGVTKVTLQTYKKRMAAFIHWLQKNEIVSDEKKADPFTKLMTIKIPKRKPEDMDDSIIKMVLASYGESFEGVRDRTILEWFLETGMRLGGVLRLKINQFDWETGKGHVIEKGNKERTIVMSQKLQAQVKKYMLLREPRARDDALWITSTGAPLSEGGISKICAKMNNIPGVKEAIARLNPGNRFHPHLFRHVWAKHLALSEVPGFAMMVMGGWEDLELVQHYARAYNEDKAWSYINKASPLNNIV